MVSSQIYQGLALTPRVSYFFFSQLFSTLFPTRGVLDLRVGMFGAIAQAATTISVDEGCEGGQSTTDSAGLQDVLVQMCYSCKLCFPYLSFLQEKD